MKEVWNCYLCGTRNVEILLFGSLVDPYYWLISRDRGKIQVTWVQCKNCGFVFRIEQLESCEIKALYDNYRELSLLQETPDQYFDRVTGLSNEDSENYQRALEFKEIIKQYVKSHKREHLDIGTGAGVFIYSFHCVNSSWKTVAVDPTPVFAEVVKNKLGIEVYNGFYQRNFFNRKFQLITMLQVLEHIYDSKITLEDISADLDERGILIVEVPSAKNIGRFSLDHDIFSIPHFCLYSKETLGRLLMRSGFKILEIKEFQLKRRETFQIRVVATI